MTNPADALVRSIEAASEATGRAVSVRHEPPPGDDAGWWVRIGDATGRVYDADDVPRLVLRVAIDAEALGPGAGGAGGDEGGGS